MAPEQSTTTGSCLCGLSTYTVTLPSSEYSVLCHCTSCHKWTGSTFNASLLFPLSALQPQPSNTHVKQYIDTADSGNKLTRNFCGACGSSMYTEVPHAGVVSVNRGGIDGGWEGLKPPQYEYWCVRKEGWVELKGIDASFEKGPDS